MVFFYLSNYHQRAGLHEIHAQGCSQMPNMLNLTYLGPFNNCKEAFRKAIASYEEVELCPLCCEKLNQSILEKGENKTVMGLPEK